MLSVCIVIVWSPKIKHEHVKRTTRMLFTSKDIHMICALNQISLVYSIYLSMNATNQRSIKYEYICLKLNLENVVNDKHIIRYIHKTYQVSAQTNFCEIHKYNNTKKGHQCNQSISEYIQVWEISRMPNQSEFEPPAHMLTQSFNVREYIALWRETIYVQQQQRNTLYDTVGCLILKLCSKPRWPKQLRRSQIHRKKPRHSPPQSTRTIKIRWPHMLREIKSLYAIAIYIEIRKHSIEQHWIEVYMKKRWTS